MTKAQRMILDAAVSDALRAAGEMAASIDMLTRATARIDAEAAGDALTKLLKARYAIDHDESEASCLGIWIQRYLLNEESAVETFEDHGWTYESFEEISRDLRNKSHLRFEGDAIELNGAPIAIEQIKEGRKKHVQEVVG